MGGDRARGPLPADRRASSVAGVAKELTVGGMEDPGAESAPHRGGAAGPVPQRGPVGLRHRRHGARPAPSTTTPVRAAGSRAHRGARRRADGIAPGVLVLGREPRRRSRAATARRHWCSARCKGSLDTKVKVAERALASGSHARPTWSRTAVTGRAEVARQISEQAEKDLQRSELMTAPIVVHRARPRVRQRGRAALLPPGVGVLAVVRDASWCSRSSSRSPRSRCSR